MPSRSTVASDDRKGRSRTCGPKTTQHSSSPLGPGLCRILDMNFAEFPFHALGCIVGTLEGRIAAMTRDRSEEHEHRHSHPHGHGEHGHTHGAVDPTIATSERGIWAIKWSFVGLMATALLQLVVVFMSGSVAL